VSPPNDRDLEVGVFSSRSPDRPNPIGLSIVRLKKIVENKVYITGIDAFDKTPLLDIKPYMEKLDCKEGAGNGWGRED
jgi:tRNA-Thr(GGU) m(6)t(6)A37 methyltransferase TsaA